MTIKQIILTIILSANLFGCATSGYFIDRGRDAADIFTATAGIGAGAKVRIGPANLGLPVCLSKNEIGLKRGRYLGINNDIKDLDVWLLFLGYEDFDAFPTNNIDYRGKSYIQATLAPDGPVFRGGAERYTQIDILLGLGLTFRFGFNPGELLDFILGWGTIDIYNDDIEAIKISKKKTEQGR